jgi:hypothetical protein
MRATQRGLPDAKGYNMKHREPYALAALAAAVVVGLFSLSIATANAQEPRAPEPLITLVSIPDFINADVGDVRGIRRPGYLGWDQGDPNSINRHYRQTLKTILDQVKSENPDAVLVAGDEVNGHWGWDADDTGIFGRVDTYDQKKQAVRRAGSLYYPQWKERFKKRDLRVYPAVGDHEVGDNPWPSGFFKTRAFATFKDTWARYFTADGTKYPLRPRGTPFADTAYAVQLTPEVLLVTVDTFSKEGDAVFTRTGPEQAEWVDRIIGNAKARGVEHVIVQGHVSVMTPVDHQYSSNLTYVGGRSSNFWQALKRHGVDLYLAGEAHDMTVHTDGTLVQVTHGGYVPRGISNYLVLKVYENRIDLKLKKFSGRTLNENRRLWQVEQRRPPWSQVVHPNPRSAGTMTIDKRGGTTVFRNRTGEFATSL